MGGKNLELYDKFELLLLTVVLSVLSYFLIEKPFRKVDGVKIFLTLVSISSVLIVIGCSYGIKTDGVATKLRLGFESNFIGTAEPSYLYGNKGCESKEAIYVSETQFCVLGDISKSKVDFLLVGDSHAMYAQPLLNKISNQFGLKGIFGGNSGCPPLLGIYPLRGSPHPNDWSKRCYGFNQNGYDFVKNNDVKTVF